MPASGLTSTFSPGTSGNERSPLYSSRTGLHHPGTRCRCREFARSELLRRGRRGGNAPQANRQSGRARPVVYQGAEACQEREGELAVQVGIVRHHRTLGANLEFVKVFHCIVSLSAELGSLPRSEEHTSELQSQFHLVCR